jgi:hypothetical protein
VGATPVSRAISKLHAHDRARLVVVAFPSGLGIQAKPTPDRLRAAG